MSRSQREYLQHMIDKIQFILDHTYNHDQDSFVHDETLKRAVVRSLEIIGEAAKHIPDIVWHRLESRCRKSRMSGKEPDHG